MELQIASAKETRFLANSAVLVRFELIFRPNHKNRGASALSSEVDPFQGMRRVVPAQ